MRPILRAAALVLLVATSAVRGQDSAPPPLTAPGEAAPVVSPRTAPTPPAMPRTQPNLLRPKTAAKPVMPRLETPAPSDDLPPPLDAPAEMRMAEHVTVNSPRTIVSTPQPEKPPSLVLEPGSTDRPKAELEKIKPELPGQKKSRRFGFLPQIPPARPRPLPSEEESVRVEPRNDPAADAALKRRLETKIATAVGDKARNIEVRVLDRNVTVKAKVDRFWNKRTVRKTIESLPALSGYRAKVDVDE